MNTKTSNLRSEGRAGVSLGSKVEKSVPRKKRIERLGRDRKQHFD